LALQFLLSFFQELFFIQELNISMTKGKTFDGVLGYLIQGGDLRIGKFPKVSQLEDRCPFFQGSFNPLLAMIFSCPK